MRNRITFFAVALLLIAAPASAQTFGFGARAGVSLPMGDYGDSDVANEDAAGAELGYSAGLDLWYPLTSAMAGLSWYTSAEVAAHGVSDEAEDAGVDGGYLLFPIMTGLRFDFPVGPASLFLTGQGGLVVTKGPSFESTVFTAESEIGTDFGFAVGGGAQFGENLYAGVKYYPLGDVNFEYEGADEPSEIGVSYLDIFIGFGVM